MEFLAFASFAVLVIAWLAAPTKAMTAVEPLEERAAA